MKFFNMEQIQALKILIKEISANLDPDAFLFLYSLYQANKEDYKKLVAVIKKYVNATRISVISADIIKRLYERHVKTEKTKILLEEHETRKEVKKVERKIGKQELLAFLQQPIPITKKKKTERRKTPMKKKEIPKEKVTIAPKKEVLSKREIMKREYLPKEEIHEMMTNLKLRMYDSFSFLRQMKIIPKREQGEIARFKVLSTIQQYTILDKEESFHSLFLSRYNVLRDIIISRGIKPTNISELNTVSESAYVIIMPREKRRAKKSEGLIVVGDDPTGEITIYIPLNSNVGKKAERLLLDSVVAFKVRKGKGMCIAEDIIFPDVSIERRRHRAKEPIKAIFIADIHVGSKVFLEEYFRRFIKFISGKINEPRLKRVAKEIKYIFILGDLVDGVGVYPNHENELAVPNIYEQYRILSDFLDEIPNDKTITIIPGNHDASTRLLPQPPIPDTFAKPLYKLEHVQLLGNPSYVSVDGVKILLYHGYGVEKIAQQLGFDLKQPTKIMVEMIRNRHLCPTWSAVPMAPLPDDMLIIREVPDIFAMAHIHIADVRIMKGGTLLLTTGSFQGLTTWQRQLGIEPTPGIGIIVNFQTFDVAVIKTTETAVDIISC